jgi:hypothetical protein
MTETLSPGCLARGMAGPCTVVFGARASFRVSEVGPLCNTISVRGKRGNSTLRRQAGAIT